MIEELEFDWTPVMVELGVAEGSINEKTRTHITHWDYFAIHIHCTYYIPLCMYYTLTYTWCRVQRLTNLCFSCLLSLLFLLFSLFLH